MNKLLDNMNTLIILDEDDKDIKKYLMDRGCIMINDRTYLAQDIVKTVSMLQKVYKMFNPKQVRAYRITDIYDVSRISITKE